MKKIVYYDATKPTFIEVGKPATITPLNHPSALVTNTKTAITTVVILHDPDGSFTTKNTIYIPETPKAAPAVVEESNEQIRQPVG